jgi:ATP dependent DNA ligase-like protein
MTTALPRVRPLALKRRAQAFDNPNWLYEIKYDGFRALLEIDDAGARLLSRNRNRFKHLDPLAAALAKRLRVTNGILDGEVICVDETGRRIFLDLLRRREPCFVAFDLLWLNGEDLRPLPLIERKKRLKRLLAWRSNHLLAEAMTVEGRGKALMAAVEQHDLEGLSRSERVIPTAAACIGGSSRTALTARPMTGEVSCSTRPSCAGHAPRCRRRRGAHLGWRCIGAPIGRPSRCV